ncbi:MAG: peptidoglycan editing factor PgeF [Oscillospiraceae bacterium]|nr:peptidoglycan editing factor PgeF [Oscillospiraceae bacterium]
MRFTLNTATPVPYLSCDAFAAAGGVAHGFSTRLGGVSQGDCAGLNLGYNRGDDPTCVVENLRRFTAAIGADASRLVKTRQVHLDRIQPVTAKDICRDFFAPAPWECDGLITDEPGLCLAVFTADCVPVLLYDPVRRCIAAVHSGWRGTALSIAPKAVEQMVADYGCRRENILAAVGPCISRCCFETHADVPDAMLDALGQGIAPFIFSLPNEKFLVDLKGIVAHGLSLAGLREEHIHVTDHCTACRTDLYWSHRLLGTRRGSMASMLQLI